MLINVANSTLLLFIGVHKDIVNNVMSMIEQIRFINADFILLFTGRIKS